MNSGHSSIRQLRRARRRTRTNASPRNAGLGRVAAGAPAAAEAAAAATAKAALGDQSIEAFQTGTKTNTIPEVAKAGQDLRAEVIDKLPQAGPLGSVRLAIDAVRAKLANLATVTWETPVASASSVSS